MRIVSGFWAPTVKESHGLIRIIVPYYYFRFWNEDLGLGHEPKISRI